MSKEQGFSIESLRDSIKECDRTKPYLYVSYSTRDWINVYTAVKEIQESNLNVWIDIPANFNTGKGYNSSIFEALESPNCKGILFFMSEDSMTSAQTCKEIAYAESPAVKMTHNVALPLVVVEMLEIDNHDIPFWVEGSLYQTFKNEPLSHAEFERIEKYRNKYNSRLGKQNTKYDLSKTILEAIKQYESERVDYQEDRDSICQDIVEKVAKQTF